MAVEMVRTQIYLEKEQYQHLKQLSKSSEKTMAALIREAIDCYLIQEQSPQMLSAQDPIFDLIGMFESDSSDGSRHRDTYLYDAERQQR